MIKWVYKHKVAAFLVFNLLYIVLLLPLFLFVEASPSIYLSLGIAVLCASLFSVFSTGNIIITKTSKLLDEECDPYPLLEAVELQLKKVKSKCYEQLLLISKATALRATGQFDEVLSILSNINIDKYSTTLPVTKIVYYNNLMDIHIVKGNLLEANIWYSKTEQLISDTKMKDEHKQQLLVCFALNRASLLLLERRLDEMESVLSSISEPLSNRMRIEKCMLFAKLYISQNRIEDAKPNLQFVIERGNKLYEVSEAKEILATLK